MTYYGRNFLSKASVGEALDALPKYLTQIPGGHKCYFRYVSQQSALLAMDPIWAPNIPWAYPKRVTQVA